MPTALAHTSQRATIWLADYFPNIHHKASGVLDDAGDLGGAKLTEQPPDGLARKIDALAKDAGGQIVPDSQGSSVRMTGFLGQLLELLGLQGFLEANVELRGGRPWVVLGKEPSMALKDKIWEIARESGFERLEIGGPNSATLMSATTVGAPMRRAPASNPDAEGNKE